MGKLFNYIATGCLFCLLNLSFNVGAHSVQVGYCINCNGNLRLYVEHWHTIPDYTTTMSIDLTVNGVTTSITGSPALFISDTVKEDLPECATLLTIFGGCGPTQLPCTANTCKYWVAYDFPNIQRGVPITITILSGNNIFTEDGCSMFPATTSPFIIPLNVAPTIGPNQTICSGSGVSIPLANFTGNLQWQYSATSGGPWTNVPGGTTAPLSTGTLNTTTYYQAVVTGDCGSLISSECAIIVGQPPVSEAGGGAGAAISSCPSNTPVSIGTTSTPGYSYSWVPGTGLSSTTISNPTASLVNTGSTTYTVTTSAPGCVSTSDAVTVTVTSLPTATMTGSATTCQGATTNITFTGANGTAPYTFTYKINGGSNLTVNSIGNVATLAANTSSIGTITYDLVSVQDASAITCSQNQSATVVITVNTPPVASISGGTTVCLNDPAPVITFTGSAGTAPYTFTYTINGGSSTTISTNGGNTAILTAPISVAGTFTYSVTGIMDATLMSCGAANASTTVIVTALPVATVTGTASVCLNGPQPDITFTGLVGSAPFTFNYTLNGGSSQSINTTSGNTVNLSVPTTSAGTFIYTIANSSSSACSNNSGDTATITVNPLPTAAIAGTASVCQNEVPPNITFTGITGTPPFTFTYTVNGGANQKIMSAPDGVSTIVPAPTTSTGTFTYSLVSVQDSSSVVCSNAASGTAVITVNQSVIGNITGTTQICQNATAPDITFTGSNGTAPYTFTYTINGGSSQTISTTAGNSVTIQAPTTAAGAFVYELTGIQDSGNSSCYVAVGSATVTVNPLPTASISGATTVCQNGASPDITLTGANGTAPYTFTYNVNGGSNQIINTTIGNSLTIPVPTSVAGPFLYSVVSVQDGSPAACSQAQNVNATVTINPIPSATITGGTAVCRTEASPNITFTGANGTAPYSFTYTINGGAVQTISTSIGSSSVTLPMSTAAAGTFTYALVSVKDASSTTCISFANGTTTVAVNPIPSATISGPPSVCQNSAAPIVFTGSSGTAPYTFTYTVNNGPPQQISTVNGSSVTYLAPTNVSGPFVYALVSVQDGSAAACIADASGSAPITITINPLPTASISPTRTVCINDPPPKLTFTGANGTAPYTFVYTINGGTPQTLVTTVGDSISIYVPTFNTGTFTYSMVSLHDASAIACVNNANSSATITVSPKPSANFSVDPEVTTTIDPTISLANTSVGANSWVWDFGDQDSAVVAEPHFHKYADTGTYVIKLMISSLSGCSDTISHNVIIEVPFLFFIPNAFSPNADGKNEIFMPKGEGIDEFSMMIYDRWGNFIFYSDDVNNGWDGKGNLGNDVAQSDVYVYSIKLVDLKKKAHVFRGTVTLMK